MRSLKFSFPVSANLVATHPSAFKLPNWVAIVFSLVLSILVGLHLLKTTTTTTKPNLLLFTTVEVLRGSEFVLCSVQLGTNKPHYSSTCFDLVSASVALIKVILFKLLATSMLSNSTSISGICLPNFSTAFNVGIHFLNLLGFCSMALSWFFSCVLKLTLFNGFSTSEPYGKS